MCSQARISTLSQQAREAALEKASSEARANEAISSAASSLTEVEALRQALLEAGQIESRAQAQAGMAREAAAEQAAQSAERTAAALSGELERARAQAAQYKHREVEAVRTPLPAFVSFAPPDAQVADVLQFFCAGAELPAVGAQAQRAQQLEQSEAACARRLEQERAQRADAEHLTEQASLAHPHFVPGLLHATRMLSTIELRRAP